VRFAAICVCAALIAVCSVHSRPCHTLCGAQALAALEAREAALAHTWELEDDLAFKQHQLVSWGWH